jgi:hypothetical protein
MAQQFTAQQLLRAGLQSGTIMMAADTVTQYLIESRKTLDTTRTVRWGIAGLVCHGPYFYMGFSAIDKYFGATTSAKVTIKTVAKKTLAAQLILFPPYLCLLFSLMSILEGQATLDKILQKVQQRVPEAFAGGCIYWCVVYSSACRHLLHL